MSKWTWMVGATWLLLGVGQAFAQSPLAPYVEHEKRLRAAQEVAPLRSDLFGDSISLYNGAVEFAVTVIDLPGNNALPVQLRRRFKVESMKEVEPLGGFGVWDRDVPYLYGTFDTNGPRAPTAWPAAARRIGYPGALAFHLAGSLARQHDAHARQRGSPVVHFNRY